MKPNEQSAAIAGLKAQLTDAEERIELLERIVTASVILTDDTLRRFAIEMQDLVRPDAPFHGKLPSNSLTSKIVQFQAFLSRLVSDDEFAERVRLQKGMGTDEG
ncbi:hypothetical protein RA27_20375 [Ruegeria sp. ANG-R]|uniref:hypothetical protein n=1 Tax=Ruegeria sp. ANG-R TaxID=1577903 RepID=UPI00057CD2A7|nr:hypothetical protein [Ruegeria sp. ANG-R]KIC38130.1 hypothetical protein RA27_20375 [Ruegeria sp. ANG-R]